MEPPQVSRRRGHRGGRRRDRAGDAAQARPGCGADRGARPRGRARSVEAGRRGRAVGLGEHDGRARPAVHRQPAARAVPRLPRDRVPPRRPDDVPRSHAVLPPLGRRLHGVQPGAARGPRRGDRAAGDVVLPRLGQHRASPRRRAGRAHGRRRHGPAGGLPPPRRHRQLQGKHRLLHRAGVPHDGRDRISELLQRRSRADHDAGDAVRQVVAQHPGAAVADHTAARPAGWLRRHGHRAAGDGDVRPGAVLPLRVHGEQ